MPQIIAKHAPNLRRLDLAGDYDWEVDDIRSISKLGCLECLGLDKRTWSALRPLPVFVTPLAEDLLQRSSSALALGGLWFEAFMDTPSLEELQDEDGDHSPIGSLSFFSRPPEPSEAKGACPQPPHAAAGASTPSYAAGSSLRADSQHPRAGSNPGPITTGLTRRHLIKRPPAVQASAAPRIPQQHLSTSVTPIPPSGCSSANNDDGLDRFDSPSPREMVVALCVHFSQLTHLDLGHWFLQGPVVACMGNSMRCLQV